MQLMLQSIPLTETLRYALGAKAPDPLPDTLAASAKEACQALLPVCQPRYTYLVRPTQPLLEGLLSGEDIRRHLQSCEQCVLFGATLGPQADALIRRAQVDDMAKAFWLDAAASAAIEEVCDEVQRQIALELECALTARFSCGYGDLPLVIQPQFLSLLDAGRKIGLSASASGMLTPIKSVTAVIGILPPGTDAPKARPACAICPLSKTCPLKRKGVFCGIHSD